MPRSSREAEDELEDSSPRKQLSDFWAGGELGDSVVLECPKTVSQSLGHEELNPSRIERLGEIRVPRLEI